MKINTLPPHTEDHIGIIRQMPFIFQSNYHDHIIRNDREYFAIARYIQNNPANWNKDRLKK